MSFCLDLYLAQYDSCPCYSYIVSWLVSWIAKLQKPAHSYVLHMPYSNDICTAYTPIVATTHTLFGVFFTGYYCTLATRGTQIIVGGQLSDCIHLPIHLWTEVHKTLIVVVGFEQLLDCMSKRYRLNVFFSFHWSSKHTLAMATAVFGHQKSAWHWRLISQTGLSV